MKQNKFSICLMLMLLCFSQLSRGKPVGGLFISGPSAVCIGTTSTYSCIALPGDTYDWSVTPQGIVTSVNPSDPATVAWIATGAATVTVKEYDASHVLVATATLPVTVYGYPTAYITTNSMIACQNLDSLARDTVQKPLPNPLILNNNDGCIKVCDSTEVQYTAHGSIGTTFTWSATGGNIIGPNNLATVNVYWLAPGGGSLTLTATGPGGCVTTVTICFDIIQKPDALFAILPEGGPTSIYYACYGVTLIFQDLSTADAGSPIVSWVWDFGDGTTSTDENPTHGYTLTGPHTVQLVVTNACGCSDTFTTDVIVNPLKGPTIICPHEVCQGDTSSFSTPPLCASAIYNWSVIGGTIVSGAGTPNITVQWFGGADGYGYVTLGIASCPIVCPDSTTIKIPVIQTNPVITGPLSPICINTQYKYSIPLWPDCQYHWGVVGDPSAILDGHLSNDVILEFTSPGTYEVHCWYQSRTNLCGGDLKFYITVLAPPVIVGPTTGCVPGPIVYNLSPAPPTATWLLSGPGGSVMFTGPSFPANFPLPGEYKLSVTGSTFCSPDPLTINILPTPAAPLTISGPTTICYGTPYVYTATAPVVGMNFIWSITAGTGVISSSTGSTVSVIWYSAPGALSVALQDNVTPFCTGPAISLLIQVYALNPHVTGLPVVCANTYENYTDNYFTADATTWEILPSTAGSVTAGGLTPNITVLWNNTTSPITAKLIARIQQCDSVRYDTLIVTINPDPLVTLGASGPYCNNSPITFNASGGASSYTWNWGDGSTPVSGPATNSYTYNIPLTSTSPVTYNVVVIAGGGATVGGCPPIGTATIPITMYPGPGVVINITSGSAFYCIPAPILTTFTATVSNPLGTITVTWYEVGVIPPVGTGYTYTTTSAGTFYCVVTDSGVPGCPITSNMIPVSTGPCVVGCGGPGITLGPPSYNCNAVTVVGTGSGTPAWASTGPYTSIVPGAGPSCTVTYPNVGVYHIELVETFTGPCISSVEEEVVVPIVGNYNYSFNCTGDLLLTDASQILSGYTPTFDWWEDYTTYLGSGSTYTIPGYTGPHTITEIVTTYVGGIPVVCSTSYVINGPALTTPSFTASTYNTCEGNPIVFTGVTTGPSAPIYHWFFGDGSDVFGDPITRTYSFGGPLSTIYPASLTVINEYGCVVSTLPTGITIWHNDLSGSVSGADPIVTCGSPVSLSYVPGSGTASSGLWSDGNPGFTDVVSTTGNYYITVSNSHLCQFVTLGRNVDILPAPSVVISGKTNLCAGDQVSLNAYIGTDYTYQWYLGSSPITGATLPTLTGYYGVGPHTFHVDVTHTFTTLSGPTTCTYSSSSITVIVHPDPAAPTISQSLVSCMPYILKLTASSGVSSPTYNWTNGDAGASINIHDGGAYGVWVTDLNGCVSPIAATYIPPSPESYSNWIDQGCYNFCDNFILGGGLTLYGPPGVFTYWDWLMNSSSVLAGFTSAVTPYTVGGPGLYQLTLNNGYCTSTIGALDITTQPCQCPVLIYSVSAICDPSSANPAGYIITFWFYNPMPSVSATIGMDIGPIYTMPATIPSGWSSASYSFTTFDVPAPSSADGWMHFYYPGGDCYENFKVPLPTCSWLPERNSGQTAATTPVSSESSMLVFPNPAQNNVTIGYNYGSDGTNRSVVVYDVFGRKVAEQPVSSTTGSFNLSLTGIASGTYLVRMEQNGQTVQIQHLSVTH